MISSCEDLKSPFGLRWPDVSSFELQAKQFAAVKANSHQKTSGKAGWTLNTVDFFKLVWHLKVWKSKESWKWKNTRIKKKEFRWIYLIRVKWITEAATRRKHHTVWKNEEYCIPFMSRIKSSNKIRRKSCPGIAQIDWLLQEKMPTNSPILTSYNKESTSCENRWKSKQKDFWTSIWSWNTTKQNYMDKQINFSCSHWLQKIKWRL